MSESVSETVRARAADRRQARLLALPVFVACVTVLGIAVWLKPDARGVGTHEQMGGAPCGMLQWTGQPCPTCGMTTAFAHTVRGQWLRALWAQPAGFVFALGTIVLAGVSALVLVRGRWPQVPYRWLSPNLVFGVLLALLLGGWVFKMIVMHYTRAGVPGG